MRHLALLFAALAGYWLGLASAWRVEALPPMPAFALCAAALCGVLWWVVTREEKA